MDGDKRLKKDATMKRRSLLKGSLILSSGVLSHKLFAQSKISPNRVIGSPALDQAYGQISDTSLFRTLVPGDQFNARSVSPLSQLMGAITPSGLHFERHHAGVPQIEPSGHKLLVQGKKGLAKIFTMQEIKRYPQRTIPAFIECSGNSSDIWKDEPQLQTVDMLHGMTSQSFWTGVPLSYFLEAIKAPKEGAWIIAEGNDAASLARSIPIEKCWADGLLAYGQNGEPIRAEQGYPLRLLLPGWEGNCQVKWLSRLELSDKPAYSYQETAKYSDLYKDGKARLFTFAMDVKSVITYPSGNMRVSDKGFHEIRGIAWSGRGTIESVEVSTDSGRSWVKATLEQPVLPHSHTRFFFPWFWNGKETTIISRATDSSGERQVSRSELINSRGNKAYYHCNCTQAWKIKTSGEVENTYV